MSRQCLKARTTFFDDEGFPLELRTPEGGYRCGVGKLVHDIDRKSIFWEADLYPLCVNQIGGSEVLVIPPPTPMKSAA